MTSSILRIAKTFFCVAFIITVCAFARPALAQCSEMTDAQIVAHIYGKIKADSGLASQMSHINVVGAAGLQAVKLQGWVNNQSDYDKVFGFAQGLKCLKVNVNNFEPAAPPANSNQRASVGCASGTKPCGDICIPEGDVCNIGKEMISFEPTLFRFDRGDAFGLFGVAEYCS